MANEVDDIVQNIVLTGDQEAVSAFDSIREAGERAFESITKAVEHSALSFTGMATAITGVAASIAIVSVGMFEFVKSTEEGVSSLSDLAEQAGATTEEMSGIKAAFAAGGVAGGALEQAFRRLSVTIQQSWTDIKQASRQSADQLKGDALAVSNAELALVDATRRRANIERDQAIQSRQNIEGVKGAQQSLNEAQARRLANLGVDTSALDEQLARNRDILSVKQAQLALDQAKAKKADDAANFEKEALKAANAEEQAQLSLNQARRKAEDDKKNDINNVTKAVKDLVAGNEDALDGINASAENLSKGIINSVAGSTKALGGLKGDITDLSSPAPGVKETFLQLGKVLESIEDPALKTATAARLLGRTINQDFLNVLSDPGKIEEFIERVQKLGLAVNEADKEVGEKFRSTLFQLQNDIQLIGVKIATAFGPGFTTILKSIDEALIRNKDSVIAFAESIATKAVPIVESFIRVLQGAPDAAQDQWLIDYANKAKAFGDGLKSVATIVVDVFKLIVGAAEIAANSLNSVFGTNLNAVDALFLAFFAKIAIGFVRMEQAAVLAATGIQIAFLPMTAILATIVGGIYTVVKAWDALKDFFGIGGADKSAPMLDGAVDRLKAIAQILSGDIKGGMDAWTKAGEEQAKKEKELDDNFQKSGQTRKEITQSILSEEKKANDDAVNSHKAARNQIDKDSATSAANRVKDLQDVSNAGQQFVAAQKQQTDSAKQASSSAAQSSSAVQSLSKSQDTSSFLRLDEETGIRNFGSDSTSIQNPQGDSIFAARWKAIFKEIAAKEGELEAKIQTDAIMGGTIGTRGDASGFFGGRAEITHPDIIEKPPLPRERPIEADGLSKRIVDDLLEEAGKQARFQPDSLTPAFPKPGEFPQPPPQEPLSPDLQAGQQAPGRTLADVFEPLKNIADFLRSAVTDPGALKEQQRPERPPDAAPTIDASVEKLTSTFDNILNGLQNFLDAKKGGEVPANETGQMGIRGDAGEQIDSAFQTAASSIESGAQTVVSALESAAQSIIAAANSIQQNSGSSGGGGTVTAAGGGYIQGPGTPTSDSIPAWLSTEEYVHNAQAVKHYGVDFMHSINRMQFPRFALGGLVGLLSPQLPRFASGGLVPAANSGGMQHIGTIDLTTNHGTVRVGVDRGGLAQLRKAAVMRNIGKDRQPSWVK